MTRGMRHAFRIDSYAALSELARYQQRLAPALDELPTIEAALRQSWSELSSCVDWPIAAETIIGRLVERGLSHGAAAQHVAELLDVNRMVASLRGAVDAGYRYIQRLGREALRERQGAVLAKVLLLHRGSASAAPAALHEPTLPARLAELERALAEASLELHPGPAVSRWAYGWTPHGACRATAWSP